MAKAKKTVSYTNRRGKRVSTTPARYVALAARVDEPCCEGHFGCAVVEGGPCAAEIQALIDTSAPEPEEGSLAWRLQRIVQAQEEAVREKAKRIADSAEGEHERADAERKRQQRLEAAGVGSWVDRFLHVVGPDGKFVSKQAEAEFKRDFVASFLVSELEAVWATIRDNHPGVPRAVVLLATGEERGKLRKVGHWSPLRWTVGEDRTGEVLVAGELLDPAVAVNSHREEQTSQRILATMLHEAAHALGSERGIENTCNNGRYHNRCFKVLAEELGLEVQQSESHGYCLTSLAAGTAARYQAQLDKLDKVLGGFRAITARPSSPAQKKKAAEARAERQRQAGGRRISAECQCDTPKRIWLASSTLERGDGITCPDCGERFEASR